MPLCRKCGKEIVYVRDARGRVTVCNPGFWGYDIRYNDVTVVRLDGRTVKARLIDYDAPHIDGICRVPHWATCRKARQKCHA